MTIYDKLNDVMKGKENQIFYISEIKDFLINKYGINPNSIILSDYCYNRYNNGICFNKHIFVYVERGYYKYLGENYPYTGYIYHKPKGGMEVKIGEWNNGEMKTY